MSKYWTINGQGKYSGLGIAKNIAEKRYPGVVWGNAHQGTNGRIRVVGKIGEADDRVIIEQK